MTDGGHSSDCCCSTVSDAYMAHGHAVLVAGTIFKSDLHFHNQAGQHYHRIDELDIPDLDAAIERQALATAEVVSRKLDEHLDNLRIYADDCPHVGTVYNERDETLHCARCGSWVLPGEDHDEPSS